MTARERSGAGPATTRVQEEVSVQRGVGLQKDGYKPSKPANVSQPKPVAIPRPPATNGSKGSNS